MCDKFVSERVFRAIQNVDIGELSRCSQQEIRPLLPCLVRMSLISPVDISKHCTAQKIDILTLISGIELVNSIVALLSIDFHALEVDVKKEQQLRQKGALQTDSFISQGLPNGLALEFERSDATRRLRLVLSELLSIQAQLGEAPEEAATRQSDLFDNAVYLEEISDVICIALAELPTLLSVLTIAETLLHVNNGPQVICRIVANFPDCFSEVCYHLISRGDKHEDNTRIRMGTLQALCRMNPSQALSVRSKCVELCKMPSLAVSLSNDLQDDLIAFVSGLLLGSDNNVRTWFAVFIRSSQKRKGESPSSLQVLRASLLRRLQHILAECDGEGRLPDYCVVQASALLRLYCALRGIAGIKFQEEEVVQIMRLVTTHPSPTPAGVRFVSLGLCMLIACPSLIAQAEHEKTAVEWLQQWLAQEHTYFEASGSSFGEMLLLMAIHFHGGQLSAICELVCSTLGMKIPIRPNNMTRMKAIFTQEVLTEQVVAAHAVRVPVTEGLQASMPGFLPVHCIYHLLKSRAFSKHNVNIKSWIYRQICRSTTPLHPVLPLLVEVYVNSVLIPNPKAAQNTNRPLSEAEIRRVFERCHLGEFVASSGYQELPDDEAPLDQEDVDASSLAPQLLLLYYLLLYTDVRLGHAGHAGHKTPAYSSGFLSELPVKHLFSVAQRAQQAYAGLYEPLLKLLLAHLPHLCLVEDALDELLDAAGVSAAGAEERVTAFEVVAAFDDLQENPSRVILLLRRLMRLDGVALWAHADLITSYLKKVIATDTPRYIQELYSQVWFRLNQILPRKLWILTVRHLVPDYVPLLRGGQSVSSDPLQVLRCHDAVFRCPPVLAIVIRVLKASLAASRSQLLEHLQSHPHLSLAGQPINEAEREEMRIALVAAQESAAVQMLLEACLCRGQEEPGDWCLREIRSVIGSHLHQVFIADTALAKLVHFQGYPGELVEVAVRGVPSMHICLDFIPELLAQPSTAKQVFAVELLSHLAVHYSIGKSFCIGSLAVNALNSLLGVVSGAARLRLFRGVLPSLVRLCRAFPPLVEDVLQLLVRLGRICTAHAAVASHSDAHLVPLDYVSAKASQQLADEVELTFNEILHKAVLVTDVY